MTENIFFMTLVGSAIVHLIITAVMALFSRHRVQYLCLPWTNGIFCCTMLVAACFSHTIATAQPGILHPGMLLALLCACHLQSIYPLNISMPGFLLWERMWRYAAPILWLLAIYVGASLLGSCIVYIYSFSDLTKNILSSDILMRLCALGLSIYYIVNIFLLPRRMARHSNVPEYLLGYCIAMGLSVVFYTYIALFYNLTLLAIYVVLFTLLNLYLMLRTLESIALELPRPAIPSLSDLPETPIDQTEPTDAIDSTDTIEEEEEMEEAEEEKPASQKVRCPRKVVRREEQSDLDFNEANRHRFKEINIWMRSHREEWKESTFGRDRLCQATGYNRHLVLQSIRSQGFNNVHDYINSFRVAELKRMISRGEVNTLNDTLLAGFGTTQTVRACFLKAEGITLDEYLKRAVPKMRRQLA